MIGDSRKASESEFTDSIEQSFDEMFDLLSHHRRRCALAYLIEQKETISLADLAEAVATRENLTSAMEISIERINAVESSLYHGHIPKLAEAGVVEYDPDRALVWLAEDTEQIERFIALTPSGGG